MEALRRFFRMFDEGSVFKWIVVCLFVLQGLALLVTNLRTCYYLVRQLGDVTFLVGLAAVILVLALLLSTLLVLAILGFRGVYDVATRQAESYSPLSLWAKVLRVDGEAALFYLLVLAPAGCLATWFSSAGMMRYLPFPPAYAASSTFGLGLAVLLGGILWGFVLVFAAYVVAEILDLLPAIAGDVAVIRASKASHR
jgi:hypothetical protein